MHSIISLVLVLFVFSEGKADTGKLEICLLSSGNVGTTEEKTSSEESPRGIVDSFFSSIVQEGQINFSLNNDVIKANGYVMNLMISNILDVTICYNELFGIPIPQNITLNNLNIYADEYNLNGTVADMFYIFGSGTLNITLEGFTLEIKNFGLTWPLGCFTLDINGKLSAWTVNFENLMDGDEVLEPTINAIIGDMGSDIVDYVWPLLYNSIAPLIQEVLDKYFNKKSSLGQLDDTYLTEDAILNQLLLAATCTTYKTSS